jgi:hypothetical protein
MLMEKLECPHCHNSLSRYKAGMKFHIDNGEFGIKCSHCQKYIRLSKGGFKSWHYALIGGLSLFCGCIGKDIMRTNSLSMFTIFYISGFALLWLIVLIVNSIRVRI